MKVLNTDLAKPLEAAELGARLWRLGPGQASTRHRHARQAELYVVLQGVGRIRVDGDLLDPGAVVRAGGRAGEWARCSTTARPMRCGWLWGTPLEPAHTLEMTPARLAQLYADGPKALPPELGG
jgi:hypothetical protein